MKIKFLVLFLFCSGVYGQTYFVKEEISIGEWIKGDFYRPSDSINSSKLMIVVPGSGPTDRNGNQPGMQSNAYLLLAEALANRGVTVFTYDKAFIRQAIAGEFKEEEELTFDDMVGDLQGIIRYFKTRKEADELYLVGHSEGALVSILAAQKEEVDGLLSLAGAGDRIDEILKVQIKNQAPFLLEETTKILDSLAQGRQVEEINPFLESVFRKSVQPYMISWMKYDPAEEIKKLTCPILLVQGGKDLQVSPDNLEKLSAAVPGAERIQIENMNHILKTIEGEDASSNQASYFEPGHPIDKELVEVILRFLKGE